MDTIAIVDEGEYWFRAGSQCCETTIDWFSVSLCNGNYVLEEDYYNELYFDICKGDSIQVGEHYYSETGIYRDSLINFQGCDSIIIATISILENDTTFLTESICSNDNFEVGESIYNETGIYIDTLINYLGCDSIVTLDLVVYSINSIYIDTSICQGDSILIGSSIYFESGLYQDSLQNSLGCDSLIALNLVVFPQGDSIQTQFICYGDTIYVGDNSYFEDGNYIDSIINPIGCLIRINTIVSVFDVPTVELGNDTTLCDNETLILDAGPGYSSYLWSNGDVGQMISVSDSAMYSVEAIDENNCFASDSIIISIEYCTSIDEFKDELGFVIYPNPVRNQLFIDRLNNNAIDDISIYNHLGQRVFHENKFKSPIDISFLESGIYIIEIRENRSTFREKLIVKR
jgi:hypothetical protein